MTPHLVLLVLTLLHMSARGMEQLEPVREGGKPRDIVGADSASDGLLAQGSYVFILKPSATEKDLRRMTKHLHLLSSFVDDFSVDYRWSSLNAFIVRGASPTVAKLINEMDDIGLAAIVDMRKLNYVQLSRGE